MKQWMWKAICLVALTGLPAMADLASDLKDSLASAGDHAAAAASAVGAKPPSIFPVVSPAESRQGRIADYNDVCRLSRPGSDLAPIDASLSLLRR